MKVGSLLSAEALGQYLPSLRNQVVGPQGFELDPLVSIGSRAAIHFSLVNGKDHRITGFLSDRFCMHVFERNGTKGRIIGKSVARVIPSTRVALWDS